MLKQGKHQTNKNEPKGSLYSMDVVGFAVGGFGQDPNEVIDHYITLVFCQV